MAATSYLVSANRYVRQAQTASRYAINASAAAVADATSRLKSAVTTWVLSSLDNGSVPNHTGTLTATSEQYDAYAFCGDHDAVTGDHIAFVGAVAYRVKLPAAAFAGGFNIQSVAVTVNGDPYLVAGARVSVVNNSSETPEANWATHFAGTANSGAIAERTTATANGVTKWYPASEAATLVISAGGTQAYEYVWIYLMLEDYNTTSRIPWVEGGAALSPAITVTFADAIAGFTAGDNIGGSVVPTPPTPVTWDDVVCSTDNTLLNETGTRSSAFGYYSAKYMPSLVATADRFNVMIANFTPATLVQATGSQYFPGIAAGISFNHMTSPPAGYSGNNSAVVASVFPVTAHIPAGIPINSLVLSRPPAMDTSGSACSLVYSAYWVAGPIADDVLQNVPTEDHDFWMGKTQSPTIAGKTGQLLGRVVVASRPAGTLAIPVDWTPTDSDVFGTIYIIVMPIDVTSFVVNNGLIGYASIGGLIGSTSQNVKAYSLKTGVSPNFVYTHKGDISVGTGGDTGDGVWRPTVTLSVKTSPIADSQSVTTTEETPLTITLVGSDPGGAEITYSIATNPAHGTLSGTGDTRTYTPALNYSGPDSFVFIVNNGALDSNAGTVSITVTNVNDAPVANPQSVTTAEDTAKVITLTSSDPENSARTYTIVTEPAHGTLSGTGATRTYTPTANYNGSDSFTFKVNDGLLDSNEATVSITVTAVNDAPVANPQSVTTVKNTPLAITLTGSDVEGSTLTYTVVTSQTHGTRTGTAPNLTYTPALNYVGADSFTFRVNDGTVNSAVATISITVTAT